MTWTVIIMATAVLILTVAVRIIRHKVYIISEIKDNNNNNKKKRSNKLQSIQVYYRLIIIQVLEEMLFFC